jgi:hypothetical protein
MEVRPGSPLLFSLGEINCLMDLLRDLFESVALFEILLNYRAEESHDLPYALNPMRREPSIRFE